MIDIKGRNADSSGKKGFDKTKIMFFLCTAFLMSVSAFILFKESEYKVVQELYFNGNNLVMITKISDGFDILWMKQDDYLSVGEDSLKSIRFDEAQKVLNMFESFEK